MLKLRPCLLCVVLLLTGPFLLAQTKVMPGNLHKFSAPKLAVNTSDPNLVILETGFNGAIPKSKLEKIPVDQIESITLAYSKYKLSETFDQTALNQQRMDQLYAQLPGLKKDRDINWFWVEQTGCKDANACKDYFHGFIITLKSEESKFYKETELALLDYYSSVYEGMSDPKKMDSLIATGKLPFVKKCDTMTLRTLIKGNKLPKVRGWERDNNEVLAKLLKTELESEDTIRLSVLMDEKGDFNMLESADQYLKSKKIIRLFKNDLKVAPGKLDKKKIPSRVYLELYKSKSSYKLGFKAYPIEDLDNPEDANLDEFLYVTRVETICDYLDTSMVKVGKGLLSSTPDVVIKAFDRNKNWKNCLVVTDVTGSMYPYLAQFQMWHKLHLDQNAGNHDFIFFNDGDNKPDLIKVNGNVGGLYYINTSSFEQLSITMKKAMLKGGGGDLPENNIEAVIEGLKKNPNIKEVIMIADNFATPRDLDLLKMVKVPIHLILCGAHKQINPAYLKMLRDNKGSLHTMDQDLYDFSKLNEGQSIKIGNQTYRVSGGHFVKS